ncbi:MAG: HAD-IC family P-type ATPase [Candidatus Liptonbacteria bacterium]|nr:HAD-IC family P-type ATPase [Candidatus Liptonbacteria bacterium]
MEHWHTLTIEELTQKLGSTEAGLTEEEALHRQQQYGLNALPEPKLPGIFSIFLSQFASPLIYILLGAAILILFIGEVSDAIVILAVLLFNALIGTVQEGKAQNALAALKRFAETSATVLRDGKALVVKDAEVVPGDVLMLSEGEKVPADARLLTAFSLTVDEASLTGESLPVLKIADRISKQSLPLGDQRNIVFKGTNIVRGNGTAMVVTTGLNTEIGKISMEIASIDTEMPLKASITLLSRFIIWGVAAIGIFLLIVGLLRGLPLHVLFATVVSLSVSIIPEGLPVVLTLILATGVWRMAKQNVLVKKLQAVESLGQAKILAVDKTGTLTRNEMLIEKVFVNGKLFTVEGNGYEPQGKIRLNDTTVEPLDHEELVLAGRVAAFCANARATFIENTGAWKVSGDPTEAALQVFSEKVGFRDGEEESPAF